MGSYVLAIRGTYIKKVMGKALGIVDILSNEPYRSCFSYTVYIIIKDKPDRCWESEKMIRYLEERPMVVLLSINDFLRELMCS